MSNARSRQLAYFKDNIQSQDDQDEFDASRYYYNREDQVLTAPSSSAAGAVTSSPFTGGTAGNFSSHATHAIAGQNSMTPFAPSSDLLAMLSRGISTGSNEPSQTGQSLLDSSNTDTTNQPLVSGGHIAHIPPNRETRRVPFDMSDFPALAGHVSLPHCTSREPLEEDMPGVSSLPCNDNTMTIGKDPTPMDALTSAEIHQLTSEVLHSDNPPEKRLSTHPTSLNYGQDSNSNFAIQSEDFPALPGSQVVALRQDHEDGRIKTISAPHSTVLEECCPESLNQGALVTGLMAGNAIDVDLTKKARNYHTHEPSASRGAVSSSCSLSTAAFDRHASGLAALSPDSLNDRGHCDMRGHSNKPEPNRASRVVDVGLASRATRVRLTSTIKGNADAENQTKYGLLGLLDVIRMTNADLNTLALGSDLTTLGLNLNSSECLYSTFASPWAEAPITREPQFSLPLCYYMQPPPLKTSHLSKFQLETLFYIFYAMPKDVLQAYAAQELYNREWQYHQDLKLWFKRSSSADGLNFSNNQYIFFDIKTWECRVFSNMHAAGNFSSGLLHEDSVRVKFMNSS